MGEQISQLRAKVSQTLEVKMNVRAALVKAEQEWSKAVRELERAEQALALELAERERILMRSLH